jgi:hypothetical protein
MATDVIDGRNRRRSERVVLRIPIHLSAVVPGGNEYALRPTPSWSMLMAACWMLVWRWLKGHKFVSVAQRRNSSPQAGCCA